MKLKRFLLLALASVAVAWRAAIVPMPWSLPLAIEFMNNDQRQVYDEILRDGTARVREETATVVGTGQQIYYVGRCSDMERRGKSVPCLVWTSERPPYIDEAGNYSLRKSDWLQIAALAQYDNPWPIGPARLSGTAIQSTRSIIACILGVAVFVAFFLTGLGAGLDNFQKKRHD